MKTIPRRRKLTLPPEEASTPGQVTNRRRKLEATREAVQARLLVLQGRLTRVFHSFEKCLNQVRRVDRELRKLCRPT